MGVYFVTGVSGDLGSRLLAPLSSAKNVDKIIGIDRHPLRVSAAKLQYVQRDVELEDVDDLMEGVDTFVQLAPFSLPTLRKLLASAEKANVKRIVALSSAAVFGAWPTNSVPLTEDSPVRPNPGVKYAVNMAEAERLLYEYKHAHPKVDIVVLRMALTLGGGFEKALLSQLGLYAHRHYESSRPVQYLHIDDAVSALTLASTTKLDGTYNVAPDGFTDDVKARAVAGAPPRPGLPAPVAYIFNDLNWRSKKRANFAAISNYLEYPWVLSNDKLRATGWQPSYSTEETLVAEAKPTWWGKLGPGQRRAIITGTINVGIWGTIVGVLGGLTEFLRRKRRS